ncbi:uncharacterized protein LOC134686139 [Mytilus trossulus]|uniref:uncharacterized protein LOC134686139 n=1 Tax=Mytilus trossulus TaxID=6551 RepID=UPI0030067CCC
MPLKNSYVVWNNKGGAGKTTLTFHLSTEYALSHPLEEIVVLDMCPQTNASSALLSNVDENDEGIQGDEVVREMANSKVDCNDAYKTSFEYDKTVCGYLMAQIDKRGINFEEFLVRPAEYNEYIPRNMQLLCGDHYLEVIAKRLEGERMLPPTRKGPWKVVTEFMKEFVTRVVASDPRERVFTFFIDTNPSFSVYTELAMLAATRIIVPFNADDFSRTAVKSMLYLLYGIEIDNERQMKYEHLREYEFWYRAKKEGFILPKIHLLINNKITQYRNGVAKAFGAKESEIRDHIKTVMHEKSERFVHPEDPDFPIIHELNDFHTIAVQCLQLGCPLRDLPAKVQMADVTVPNAEKVQQAYLLKLQSIVQLL